MRIYDENMPPQNLQGKTLHQRTKSVPALSTVHSAAARTAAAAALTAANKKVLGEVNANVKVLQPAKDDSVLGKKIIDTDIVKPQPLPLARPATRPSTAKSFSTITVPTLAAAKDPIVPLQEPARKLVVKKNTKVLKDSDIIVAPGGALPSVASETHVNESATIGAPVLAPVHSVLVDTVLSQDLPLHENVNNVASLPQQGYEDKDCTQQPEVQVEQSQPSASALASTTAVPLPAQQRFEEDATWHECDDYFTAQSMTTTTTITSAVEFPVALMPKHTEKTRATIQTAKSYVDSLKVEQEYDDEEWDTSMVAEYSEEIFEYMRKLEITLNPDVEYMERQEELQWSMRNILVDWVIQVHHRFNLLPETLFLTINCIDRFLSVKVVSLGKLQLVGATAIFLAAKFEEVNCPTLNEILYMVDGGYTMDELLKAERFMLMMLDFSLGWPGPMSFLRRISKADDYDLETRTLAKYFLEVTLMDERFVGCTPSFLAAGAHCLARLMLRKGDWTTAHVAYSEYTYLQIHPLISIILECCYEPHKHHAAVYEKYTDKRYKRASTFVQGELLKGFKLLQRPIHGSSIKPISMADGHY